jgi:enoyl-CoA hydratase
MPLNEEQISKELNNKIMYSTLVTNTEDHILTITINRPDKLNALNKTVFEDLEHAIDAVYSNDQVKAVIITGAGEKAFVAGADISEFITIGDDQAATLSKKGQDVFFKIENCPKPVIAAVNGFALGGGCELAMACHFRLASSNAKFGQPEVNLGLIPGYGGTQRLTMLVGKGKALELMMTGNLIGAEEAKSLGLVNYVEPLENLLPKTKEILKTILSKSPVAVSKVIEAVNSFYNSNEDGYGEEVHLFSQAFLSDDKKEGTAAFIEKRKPSFKGN